MCLTRHVVVAAVEHNDVGTVRHDRIVATRDYIVDVTHVDAAFPVKQNQLEQQTTN